ncbi:MAG: LysR substrate-binding domain-containing protein [Roseibium sp.]
MRRPNLNRLAMFDAAARHLNFGLAARDLNVTQGAVAQQVRALEAELHLKLFDRLPRGLELTQTGRSYHARIQRALLLIDEATEAVSPQNNRITLSLPPSLASKWLVSRLANFQEKHPDIELITSASEQLSNFQTDGIDIAIRHGIPPFSGGLVHEHLADLNLSAVCSPVYSNTIGEITNPMDLIGFKLIEDAHNSWSKLTEAAGRSAPANMIKFSHSSLAIDAAVAGQGIALVPDIMLEHELSNGSLIELWPDLTPHETGYFIVYPRKPKRASKERDVVITWLRRQKTCSI